jgi:glycosyltransferase involved in cell wall biosynthesis
MTARPRVLIIGPTPPPFIGPAVNTRALLDHPALRQRFEVTHLDTADRRDITNLGRFDWTNVWLAGRHGAEFLARLVWQRPALVYLPISPSFLGLIRDLEFLIPTVLRGAVLVIHQRGGQMREFYGAANPALRSMIRFVFSRCARLIVLGEHFRAEFDGLIAPDRIVVVPNGIDPRPYLAWRPPDRPRTGPVRVVYLSNLVESKGYRLVLEVARRLAGTSPPVEFVLAGQCASEADRDYAERFVRDHGLAGSVAIPGVVTGSEKIDLLCGADVFVLPTAYPYEGHPTVLVEAMAAGLPIVSTRHVAIPETIADGRDGFLVDVGDVDALADRIRQLATDAPLRALMGAASRGTMLARYTLDRCAQAITEVFAAALETSVGSPA